MNCRWKNKFFKKPICYRVKQNGAALTVVLVVLTVLCAAVIYLLSNSRQGMTEWGRELKHTQAFYIAESGIAYQLYWQKYADTNTNALKNDSIHKKILSNVFSKTEVDSFAFLLDTNLKEASSHPRIKVNAAQSYLEIISTGVYREDTVTLMARFGRALNDSLFGAALTLDGTLPLEQFPPESIIGDIHSAIADSSRKIFALPMGFSRADLINGFCEKKYQQLELKWKKQMQRESGPSGNGVFDKAHPFDFNSTTEIFYPLGDIEINNSGNATWDIWGPGTLAAQGDIRIRGNIRLHQIDLLAGRNIIFEENVKSENLSVFAQKKITVMDQCRLDIQAVAGGTILFTRQAQSMLTSVLLSVGKTFDIASTKGSKNNGNDKGKDSTNAIRAQDESILRGFVFVAGSHGHLVLSTARNRLEGIGAAQELWISGSVQGTLLGSQLRCNDVANKNCLGEGKINRSLMPEGLIEPLDLEFSDKAKLRYRLMDWKKL